MCAILPRGVDVFLDQDKYDGCRDDVGEDQMHDIKRLHIIGITDIRRNSFGVTDRDLLKDIDHKYNGIKDSTEHICYR